MTELVVCSGKGGTGKTSVTASLAALAEDLVLADCDVDAANLHLVLAPEVEQSTPFVAGHQARIRSEACLACGECQTLCQFAAIDRIANGDEVTYRVDPLACEGCGVCVHFCPVEAIDFPERHCGEWRVSRTRYGPLVHARLDAGAANSGKLVTMVRRQANELAGRAGLSLILVDGPPGIGCPVTAALTGADATLLVAEPSLSSLHDLERMLDLAAHFDVPAWVCINKFDLSLRLSTRIAAYCRERGVPLVGRIPYDSRMNDAQTAGQSLIEFAPDSDTTGAIKTIWNRIEYELLNLSTKDG